MNKKIAVILFCMYLTGAHSQSWFRGVGIFGALTESQHHYYNQDTKLKATDDTTYTVYHPQTHYSKEYFSWGAGIFLELSRNENVRWQTELEYCNKGASEKELINGYTGERSPDFSVNKYGYLQWNNYLKFWYPAGFAHWYWMIGIRLEYKLTSSATVLKSVSGAFPSFWFNPDLGVGYEYPFFKKYSLFAEYHLNPDVLAHTHGNTKVWNRTLELRIGIVMRPQKRRVDDCNAPVYRGPAY
jgi:hypothetical protein